MSSNVSPTAPSPEHPSQRESDPPGGPRLLPGLLGIGVVLALGALLAFWPADATRSEARERRQDGPQQSLNGHVGPAVGVQARSIDNASNPRMSSALSHAVANLAPHAKPEGPPAFDTPEQEIAWYQKQLSLAQQELENRKRYVDRLPGQRERLAGDPNAKARLEQFERTEKNVHDSLARAQRKVEALRNKLAELQRG